MSSAFLEITYHANNIYVHEIALHPDYDVDDFRPPFFIAVKIPSTQSQTALTPPYINAIIQCISSADALILAFLSMGVEEVIQCPVLVFVRVVYATVVLIKLSISASMPSSELGKIIAPESNKIDTYLEQLLIHLRTAAKFNKGSKHVVSSKFLGILTKLKLWCQSQKQQSPAEIMSNGKPKYDNDGNDTFYTPPDLQSMNAQDLKYEPAMGAATWSGHPPQHHQSASRYPMPSIEKAGFFTDFAKGPTVPAVDQSGSQTIQPTSWPTTFHTAAPYSDPAAGTFNYPMEADPSLFTHLVNAELDQNNQDSWLPDADSLSGLDYSNLPEFNWATWPQQ